MGTGRIDSKSTKFLLIITTSFIFCSCSSQNNKSIHDFSNGVSAATTNSSDKLDRPGSIKEGQASVYADKFQGKKTASGAVFDQNQLTAANKEHAFGSRLKVTNKKTGRSTVVTVTDRGPYTTGRVIDLSKLAAQQIGMPLDGVTDVIVQKLE